MAKIALNKLNLNKITNINKITIGENEIEVSSYLSIQNKMDLIQIVIQESSHVDELFCNPVLLDILFHFYLIKSYTNISFSKTQEENIFETYDLLEKNGVIAEVLSAIPKNEYNDLLDSLNACVDKVERENSSVINIIRAAINKAETLLEDAKEQLTGLDLSSENIQNVITIAKDNGAI